MRKRAESTGWYWKAEDGESIEKPDVDRALIDRLVCKKDDGIFVEYYRSWKKSGAYSYVNRDEDVLGSDIVKRIFQEVYLGEGLFKIHYGVDPEYYRGAGLIDREHLIPEVEWLAELGKKCHLAIATGRPRDEAVYPLERFGIYDMFECLVTEDDIQKAGGEHLRKPDPFSIQKCIERFPDIELKDIYYIGDMPDDMIAAKRAGVIPVGFVNVSTGSSVDRSENGPGAERADEKHISRLYKNGAKYVLNDFKDIFMLAGL